MFKNNYIPGEKVLAADLNDIADAVITNQHNILELYLENYFASKNTPFQGLIFDGFSDTNKATIQSGSTVSGTTGTNEIIMTNQTERDKFSIGDVIHISDASKQEVNTVSNKTSGSVSTYSEASMSTFTYSETDPNGTYSDGGVVSSKRRLNTINGGDDTTGNAWATLSKTFNVTNGVTYTITFDKDLVQNDGGMANRYTTDITIDGASKGTVAGTATGTQTFTHTASGSTMTIELKTHRSVTGLNGFAVVFDFYNFSAFYTAYKIITTVNLANNYGAGTVKHTSATVDTSNKRLSMTAGIGDLKKVIYQTLATTFTQLMEAAHIWIMRKVITQIHPNSSIAAGGNQTAVTATAGTFMIGDIIDVLTADKTIRERKTISNISESGGNTTITFSPVIQKTGGFSTSDWVERVDIKPQISIVGSATAPSYQDLTYEESVDVLVDGEAYTEDAYSYTTGTPNIKVQVKLEITRGDTTVSPLAKRLGISLNT